MLVEKNTKKIFSFFAVVLLASFFVLSRVNAAGFGVSVGTGSTTLTMPHENLYYGVTSAANDQGNFLLFEKGSGNAIFKIDHDGNITTNGSLLGSNSYWNINGSDLFASSTAWNIGIGTTTSSGFKLNVVGDTKITGALTANSFNGTYNGTIGAPNVSSGTFGANTGNGNFTFPANVILSAGRLEVKQNMTDYNTAFTTPHLRLAANSTVDNTGFVGITFDSSTSANYGWSIGSLRSVNGIADFVWKNHQSSAAGTEVFRIASIGNVTASGDLTVNGGDISLANNNGGLNFNDASAYWLKTATNWGLYWDTSLNQFKFNGSGTTRAAIDLDDGNAYFNGTIGVGTTAPNQKLDVAGNVFVRGSGTLYNNAGSGELQVGYGLASSGTAGSVTRLALQPYGHTGGPWKFIARDSASTAYLDFDYGSTHGITLDSSGNLGIGTTTPGSFKLNVQGNANISGTLTTTGITGITVAAPNVSSGAFAANTGGGNFSFPAKLGIGTTAPRGSLDIGGYYTTNSVASSSNWVGAPTTQFIPLGTFYANSNVKVVVTLDGCSFGGSALEYMVNKGYSGTPRVYYMGPSSYGSAPQGLGSLVSFKYENINNTDYYLGMTVSGGCNDSGRSVIANTFVVGPANFTSVDNTEGNYAALSPYPYLYNGYEGNVGIGTTAPAGNLDVASAGTSGGYWLDGKSALTGEASDNWLRINNSGTWTNGIYTPGVLRVDGELRQGSADAGAYGIQTNGSFYSAGTSILAATSGSVGIGTTSPSQKLSVIDTLSITNTGGAQSLLMGNQDSAGVNNPAMIQAANGTLYFGGGTSWAGNGGTFTSNMTLTDGGSVGIGTTNPGVYKLYVNGNTYINGQVTATGITGITVAAPNVSSGTFGANTGNGNFGFPADLTVGGNLSVTGYINSVVGYKHNGSAASGSYLRGNGTNFVSSTIQAADVPTLNQNTSGYAGLLVSEDNRTISPSELAANRLKFGFTAYDNNNAGPWADFIHLRSYQDSSGGADNLLVLNRTGLGARLYQQAWGTTTAYTTFKDIVLAENTPAANYVTKYSSVGDNVSVIASQIYDNGTGVGIGTTVPGTHKLNVNGTISATSYSGTYNGTIGAPNVSSGTFAANTGGGNFVFPSSLGIGTTTMPSFPALNLDVFGRAVIGNMTSSRSSYGNTLNLSNANGTDTSLFLWQSGVASGHIGFAASSNLLRITNSSSDGSLTNAASIVLTSTGNVGIGTASPNTKLQVNGPIVTSAGYNVNNSLPAMYDIGGNAIGATQSIYSYGAICSGNASASCNAANGTVLGTNNTSATNNIPNSGSVFFNSGNVGIGTTNPSSSGGYNKFLHIQGGYASLILDSTTSAKKYEIGSSAAGGLDFYDGASSTVRMTINHVGNVGIGTVDPGVYKLNVNGNTNITGNLNVTGGVTGVIVSAPNVSNGEFGANTGGGNYVFGATVGGNVGIGTTVPATKLHVYSVTDGVFNGLAIDNRKTYGAGTGVNETSKLILSLSEVGATDPTTRIFGYMEAGVNNETSSADGWLAFGSRTGGTATEKLRITSTGNVGVGTTNPGTYKLYVNGTTNLNGATNVNGSVTWSNGNSSHLGTGANVTTYVGNSSVNNAVIRSNDNNNDAWLMNWGDSTAYGIYNRNIDSSLVVAGALTVPANSTAFIGGGLAKAYINHATGDAGFAGAVSAASYSGTYNGTIGAPNVSSGVFGANTGGGHYKFPSLVTMNTSARFAATGDGFYFGEQSAAYRDPAANIPAVVIRTDEANAGLDETKASLVLYNANGGLNTGAGLAFASREAVGAGNDVALSGVFGIKESAGTAGAWSQGGLRFWTKNNGNIIDAMALRYDGNVGIGTTNPGAKLDVTNSGGIIGRFTQTAGWTGSEYALYVSGYSYLNGFRVNAADGTRGLYKTASGGSLGFATSGDDPIIFTQSDSSERMRIAAGGNVGIGTTTPGSKLTVVGTVSATAFAGTYNGTIGAPNVSSGSFGANTGGGIYSFPARIDAKSFGQNTAGLKIFAPGGASYVGQDTSLTGAIKIKLPVYRSNTMMRMTVKIYQYSSNKSYTIDLGGYNYQDGSWVNTFANVTGGDGGNLTVRFGNDGTNDIIWIGELASTWIYPQVFVTDFEAGYSNYTLDNWDDNWAVSFVTAFNNVATTAASALTWNSINDGAGSTIDADLLDGLNSTNLPYYPIGNNANYNVTAADGNGLRFWNGSSAYKISMGVGSLYQYGPVTDYSIKTQMDAASTNRGFTWGREGVAPIAALNSTSGNMQIAGTMTAASYSGTYNGTIAAPNVASGAFGANTGGGNYSFPGGLTVTGGLTAGTLTSNGSITAQNGDIALSRSGTYGNFSNYTYSDTAWHGARMGFNRYRGSSTVPTAVVSGDTIGWFDYFGHDGSTTQRVGNFSVVVDGAVSSGVVPGKFIISTANTSGANTTRLTAYANDKITMSTAGGGVGIGTADPGTYKLYVGGTANVTGLMTMGGGASITGNLSMASGDITANKITVNTIDPLYSIDGTNYASFAASIVGGVKEEVMGKLKINNKVGDEYQAVINFDQEPRGTDLWVWRKVIDFNKDNIEVSITPYGNFANTYYYISGNSIIFKADKATEVSYRLTAKRFDWKKWPTIPVDQSEKAGMTIK